LTSQEFKDTGFADQEQSTSKFTPNQVWALQFSAASSYQWVISQPDLQTLNSTLTGI